MVFDFKLLESYPWLPSLKSNFSSIAEKDPIDFISDLFNKNKESFVKRVYDLFNAAFENLEEVRDFKTDDLNISLYLFLKIFLFVLNEDAITNRIANLYSKLNFGLLLDDTIYNLHSICKDLDLDFKFFEPPVRFGEINMKGYKERLEANFSIHYSDFLELSLNLRDDYRKLVNNSLNDGYVFLENKRLKRLIQEYIRNKILEIKKNKDSKNAEFLRNKLLEIEDFRSLYDSILQKWDVAKESIDYDFDIKYHEGEDFSEVFPPCLKEILSKMKEGQNLIHIERLFLVFLLHALEYPIQKIVNVFSTMPDFDRDKTEYQVNFAKKKGYAPHSCATLKSLGLCMAKQYKDELCMDGYYSKKNDEQRKISHPLFYIQLKKFRFDMNQQNDENTEPLMNKKSDNNQKN